MRLSGVVDLFLVLNALWVISTTWQKTEKKKKKLKFNDVQMITHNGLNTVKRSKLVYLIDNPWFFFR